MRIGPPDIVVDLGEVKVAIEADGDYWHNYQLRPWRELKDREKDARLRAAGYMVFRFREREIKRDVHGCIDRVEEYLRRRGVLV